MTYVPCRGCIEKGREPPCYVPSVLQACCDCWLATPQERERELDRLRTALERTQRTQRDRFAEAALSAGHSARESWDTADTMIELRDKSHRERNGPPIPHTCAASADNCFRCGKSLNTEDP